MNLRIAEIEAQAWQLVDKEWDWTNPDNPSKATLFKTKFAELIVRKCADAADMAYDARCKYPGDYVVESMGLGAEEGAVAWRTSQETN